MPRNVRNFWVKGNKKSFGGGSLILDLYQRERGDVTLPISIRGIEVDGNLSLRVHNNNTQEVWIIRTEK